MYEEAPLEKTIDELAEVIAKGLLSGESKEEIVRQLGERGCSQDLAELVVDEVEKALTDGPSPEVRAELAHKFQRKMVYGCLWFVGGATFTLVTYMAAKEQGGVYCIAWSAMLFGVLDFLRGLFGWLRYRS